jgi:hypothetical protein
MTHNGLLITKLFILSPIFNLAEYNTIVIFIYLFSKIIEYTLHTSFSARHWAYSYKQTQ